MCPSFSQDHNDPQYLRDHFDNIYSHVSNQKINFNKVNAVSLFVRVLGDIGTVLQKKFKSTNFITSVILFRDNIDMSEVDLSNITVHLRGIKYLGIKLV